MVERIERVTRVKTVDNDVGNSFNRKSGYDDTSNGKSFAEILRDTIRGGARAERGIPAAYALELSNYGGVTQSLFYDNSVDVSALSLRIQSA